MSEYFSLKKYQDSKERIEKAFNFGCCVEVIMKDDHTLANKPGNVVHWAKLAKEEAFNAC